MYLPSLVLVLLPLARAQLVELNADAFQVLTDRGQCNQRRRNPDQRNSDQTRFLVI